MIAELHSDGIPEGRIRIRLSGTAGQSLGAFLIRGIELHLDGTGNDYVGKGMGGGSIAIVPRQGEEGSLPHGAGNAVLYGATGGRLFIAGTVGQRFAVRNSGAAAVVEGCSHHGCEYMTGGAVAILGRVDRNLAAGMTGGVLFVWDPEGTAPRFFAETAPAAGRPDPTDLEELRPLIEEHRRRTGSEAALRVLEEWEDAASSFWILRASEPEATRRVTLAAVSGNA
jgi:glutamate synthase domain-containing protein 3